MTKGTKHYFRHSVFAHRDEKIIDLITKHGKAAGWHFWVLVEMCAEQVLSEHRDGQKFVFHARRVCDELMVTRSRLSHHLLAIQSSLGGHWVSTESTVEIVYDNILKYIGSYDSSGDKGKERKEKESKINEIKLNKIKEKEIKEKEARDARVDINVLYEKYPRKKGKKKGLALCKKLIDTSGDNFEKISKAIDNYAAHIQKTNTSDEYIKYFSSFISTWEDWLNPEDSEHENDQNLVEKILEIPRKFGPNYYKQAMEYIGDDGKDLIKKFDDHGYNRLCNAKENEMSFIKSQLIGILKAKRAQPLHESTHVVKNGE